MKKYITIIALALAGAMILGCQEPVTGPAGSAPAPTPTPPPDDTPPEPTEPSEPGSGSGEPTPAPTHDPKNPLGLREDRVTGVMSVATIYTLPLGQVRLHTRGYESTSTLIIGTGARCGRIRPVTTKLHAGSVAQ